MASRVLTPANQITILRLVFVPLFAILVLDRHYAGAMGVLAAAAVSDVADGLVARRYHQVSSLGMALDPLADKTLLTTAYLVLSFGGVLPWWLTIIVLSRDIGMLLIALVISLVADYRPFPPTILGKASTAVQVSTVIVALGFKAHVGGVTKPFVAFWIYFAAALTILSGIHYLVVARNRYSDILSDTVKAR
ncbi:MAG TPA: CDP-alcohol phosphatidyltransferase family protein [Terriglobia bacterium]|nr:CDP-alcohol phosphatidyltransferase family protein [Terriglobia bacterium]